MKLKLESEKLREILINFYNVAKVRTVIFDDDFNRTIAYPEESCDFCSLIKQNPVSKELCRKNDKKACGECRNLNSLYIYKCHAGLFEAVAPIKMNDITLGYIMFGQVREKGSNDKEILNYASKYTENEELLKNAFKKIAVRTEAQIKSIAKIMEICTCYLWIAKLINIDEGNLIFHLSNYINNNICEDLSVETLCNAFKISRSKLYDISHKYYGMSIAKYIRKRRVAIAAELLAEKNCKINEAAEFAGFSDYNYFSKIFKSEMKVTPMEYKKSAHKELFN